MRLPLASREKRESLLDATMGYPAKSKSLAAWHSKQTMLLASFEASKAAQFQSPSWPIDTALYSNIITIALQLSISPTNILQAA